MEIRVSVYRFTASGKRDERFRSIINYTDEINFHEVIRTFQRLLPNSVIEFSI